MLTGIQTSAALLRYKGVSESPAGSNCQQFSSRVGRPCEAWCADYQSCVFWLDLAFDFGLIGLPKTGTPGCAVFTGATKRAGWFSFFPRAHAWIHFGPGGGSHIEYVLAVVLDDGTTTTDPAAPTSRIRGVVSIGGNTSAPNNYAGGTVAVHQRMFGPGDDIYGYGYLPLEAPAPPDDPEDDVPYLIAYKRATPQDRPAQYAVVAGHIFGVSADTAKDLASDGAKTYHVEAEVYDKVAAKAE